MTGAAKAAWRSFGWLAGPAAWAAFFVVAYTSESLVCTRMGEFGWHGAIVLTAAFTTALLIAGRFRLRPEQPRSASGRFRARAGRALAWLSLLAIGWTTLVVPIVPACS